MRLQHSYGEMTGTMKFVKGDYVKTGFNPSKTSVTLEIGFSYTYLKSLLQDMIFFRDDGTGTFVRMSDALHDEICSGMRKF